MAPGAGLGQAAKAVERAMAALAKAEGEKAGGKQGAKQEVRVSAVSGWVVTVDFEWETGCRSRASTVSKHGRRRSSGSGRRKPSP